MAKFWRVVMVILFVVASSTALAAPRVGADENDGVKDLEVKNQSNEGDVRIRLMNLEGGGDWGGFGGAMITYLPMDLDALAPMTEDRGFDNFDDQLLLIGGFGGLIYQDFRLGGFGFGNSYETSGKDAITDKRIAAEMSIGGGGLFVELNHAFSPAFGLAAGAMLGAGSISLSASGRDLVAPGDTDPNWDADGSFFMAYPYVGAWVAPVSWMWIQADVGYLYFNMDTGGDSFENDLGVAMVDGDLTGGVAANLKICFGYNPGAAK